MFALHLFYRVAGSTGVGRRRWGVLHRGSLAIERYTQKIPNALTRSSKAYSDQSVKGEYPVSPVPAPPVPHSLHLD